MSNPFETGDRIRFINEAMEGTVSRIFTDSEVEVRDENGFHYRVKVSEIVGLSNIDVVADALENNPSVENISESDKENFIGYFQNFHSCFLCFVPENLEELLHSSYSVFIINTSERTILFSLQQLESADGISSFGIVNPGQEWEGEIITNNHNISKYLFLLSFISHPSGKNSDSDTSKRKFSFTPEDFLNEKLFFSKELFRNHILAFDINAKDEMKIPEGEITKLVDHFSTGPLKVAGRVGEERKKNYYETDLLTNEKTVDLHIEELTDDYSGMSNIEMSNIQFEHFKKELDNALLNNYYRIIFIHGKGNGSLKKRIRNELDAMSLKYRDAHTSKFGFGATEVFL